MGMVEGSGESIPTAAEHRNDIYNEKSKHKRALICTLMQLLYFNYNGEKIPDPYIRIS